MIRNEAFDRFLDESPVSVMARALFENALPASEIDRLFDQTAQQQYTRELLFSQAVDLMSLVVCDCQPSLSSAIRKRAGSLPVTRKAVYDKINRMEPAIGEALVHFASGRLAAVLAALAPLPPQPVAGHRLRILDGNHLPASEHRVGPLRFTRSGALPGHALVAYDPVAGLVTDAICCEDGHAQERSMTPRFLALVRPGDLWVADRNFCTTRLLAGLRDRGASFVIRQHSVVRPTLLGEARGCGRCETGTLSEQDAQLDDGGGGTLALRRVSLRLDKPTRDGEAEIHLLTDLPRGKAGAAQVADLYRKRWRIEAAFGELESALRSEIPALGQPKAALFAFCVALCAFDVVAALKAAVRAAHAPQPAEMSGYHLADEVGKASRGLLIAVPPPLWAVFQGLEATGLADWLLGVAGRVSLAEFKKDVRGPKKPRPKRSSGEHVKHVSTMKLLDQWKK